MLHLNNVLVSETCIDKISKSGHPSNTDKNTFVTDSMGSILQLKGR